MSQQREKKAEKVDMVLAARQNYASKGPLGGGTFATLEALMRDGELEGHLLFS